MREGNWERESNDNYVYNGGTITNRIDEQKTVSVTKEWDASSFQAGLGNVEVEMTLYERVKGSTDKWVKSNPEKIIKMDEFSAVNASMSGSTTVPTYNALGQEMEYRFFETKITQEDKVSTSLLQNKNCSLGRLKTKNSSLLTMATPLTLFPNSRPTQISEREVPQSSTASRMRSPTPSTRFGLLLWNLKK